MEMITVTENFAKQARNYTRIAGGLISSVNQFEELIKDQSLSAEEKLAIILERIQEDKAEFGI